MANSPAMNAVHVSVAEFQDRLAELVALAERGNEVVVCREDRPVARLAAVEAKPKKVNRSQRGSMKGTVEILRDLTEPFIPESAWEMLK
jgi:antitoxin (DNA-binding transcriptional repressor) of toxin-antitoxin stability system